MRGAENDAEKHYRRIRLSINLLGGGEGHHGSLNVWVRFRIEAMVELRLEAARSDKALSLF